ncbi:MAG: DUF3782 domain-containing protein [Candidatus Omnitrophota bacterium]|jgi:hypothetical protein|nr:MAG: DUF3782 domain-containing protein [Candidatus Omnitrophota bacterium]
MTTLEMEKGFQEIRKLFEETNKQIKATDRKLKETDDKIEKLIGRWSLFVEGLVVPATKQFFRERGIAIQYVSQHVDVSRDGREEMEIDILGVNGEYAILIEAKSTLSVRNVDEHIERLKKFKTFFPEYSDRKAIGAVAGIVIRKGADKYAYKKGLFVIAQSGDTVTILNDMNFGPKAW